MLGLVKKDFKSLAATPVYLTVRTYMLGSQQVCILTSNRGQQEGGSRYNYWQSRKGNGPTHPNMLGCMLAEIFMFCTFQSLDLPHLKAASMKIIPLTDLISLTYFFSALPLVHPPLNFQEEEL